MRKKWKQMRVSLLIIAVIALMVACGEKAPDELQESAGSTLSEQQAMPSTDGDMDMDSIIEPTNPVALYKTISKYSSDGVLQETVECTYDDSTSTLSCDVAQSGKRYIFSYDMFGRAIDGKLFNSNEILIEWESFGKDGNDMIHMEYNDDGTIYTGYQYDESGNKIDSIIYASDGSYDSEDYDENGNLINSIDYGSDGSIESSVFYDYEYDSNGNIIVKNAASSYGWTSKDEYEYDANGNNIKQITYDTDGVVSCWYEYEYDDNGNKVRGSKYGKYVGEDSPILTDIYTWEYTAEENILRYVEYWQDGSIKFEEEYDTKGRMVKEFYYDDNSSILSGYEYRFDAVGRVIQVLYYDNGINSYERTYEYDSDGDVVLMRLKNVVDGRESSRIEYEYDTEGNMLRSSTYDSKGNVIIVDYQTIFFEYDEEELLTRNLVLYYELDTFDVTMDTTE